MALLAKLMMIAFAVAACGGSSFEPAVTFAADDTACESVELPGDAEDRSAIQDGVECLLAEIEAGNPVVVDFSIGTIEGDQIYTRYDYDGEKILIVSDNRLDEYSTGRVAAAVCEGLVPNTSTVPDGAECVAAGHDGFTDAEGTDG